MNYLAKLDTCIYIYQKRVMHNSPVVTMPKKGPKPDAIAANPDAARLLTQLISSGVAKPLDKANTWYKLPSYEGIFKKVHPEKFRKKSKQVMQEKYGALLPNRTSLLLLFASFLTFSSIRSLPGTHRRPRKCFR